jgi:hypothetical protein
MKKDSLDNLLREQTISMLNKIAASRKIAASFLRRLSPQPIKQIFIL